MGQVITINFRRFRLPRRLLNDGWWLESKAARPSVIVFPKRRTADPKRVIRHLTLVWPEK